MIKYSIPGMYEQRALNLKFLELKKMHPEFFYDNVEIEAIYGNPQFCIWDGGRVFVEYNHSTIEEIKNLIHNYNNVFNIPIRYVFTNCILEEKHYKNRFGNILMQLGENYSNEVVVADDKFMYYLKDKYPNYNFISSTTKCLTNKNDLKNELNRNDFTKVCLDYNFNKNIDFLKTFTPREKKQSEFLINPICGAGCPHRKDHYYLNSMSHLNYGRNYQMENCYIESNNFASNKIHKSNNISYDDIVNIYEPLGFEHYKIEGRTWGGLELLLTYCDYMIKPEYKNLVIMICSSVI